LSTWSRSLRPGEGTTRTRLPDTSFLLDDHLAVRRPYRRVPVESEAEAVEQRQRLKQFSRESRGRPAGGRVRVPEEQTEDDILRRIHPLDAEAQHSGADLQARLAVARTNCRLDGDRQVELPGLVSWESGQVRRGVYAKDFLRPATRVILQKKGQLDPQTH